MNQWDTSEQPSVSLANTLSLSYISNILAEDLTIMSADLNSTDEGMRVVVVTLTSNPQTPNHR